MKIVVKRFEFATTYTIGRLFVDDSYICYTLEDAVREKPGVPVTEWKIQNETAIPVGTYPVIIDYSNHFSKDMPHVLNVPGYEGVRIHTGNTDKDTDGCILLGLNWAGVDFVSNSKPAFDAFFPLLQKAIARKEQVILELS